MGILTLTQSSAGSLLILRCAESFINPGNFLVSYLMFCEKYAVFLWYKFKRNETKLLHQYWPWDLSFFLTKKRITGEGRTSFHSEAFSKVILFGKCDQYSPKGFKTVFVTNLLLKNLYHKTLRLDKNRF